MDQIPYTDLIQRFGIDEISHVEPITKTISRLLDGAPEYHGDKFDAPGKGGKATIEIAKEQQNGLTASSIISGWMGSQIEIFSSSAPANERC